MLGDRTTGMMRGIEPSKVVRATWRESRNGNKGTDVVGFASAEAMQYNRTWRAPGLLYPITDEAKIPYLVDDEFETN